MVSHCSAKFGGQRHCASRDMTFVAVEGQDSTYPHFDRPLLLISKAHGILCSHSQNFRM